MIMNVQHPVLDPIDERLVHAVQISPRASWSALAPIVGADSVTLARRWDRLRAEGLVYVTGHRDSIVGATLAFVEIECAPGETTALADELALDREAFTIELTAGGRDIVVTLGAADLKSLAEWTFERVQPLHRVRSMRTNIVSQVITDARNWRMRSLTAGEVAAVQAIDSPSTAPAPRLLPEQMSAFLAALGADGRVSAAAIAAETGIPVRKVRETISAMRASGNLVIRVDVARSRTAWPIAAWYFLRVPGSAVGRVAAQLGRMEEVRFLANTIGASNMMMSVWLRTLGDVQKLEATIEERMPGVVIVDRSVVLRTVKHMGHLLDVDGYATGGNVPIGGREHG
ncbi:Lrp/AsnC family transcriptional regulator [Subtercola endophyticus]|uniref:Lrp/AsnC family transcriptional regulator n=1 Tax=Subtercola endophyticus TaxID=2895559 RepID=UPI001E5F929A|nr:AsnC family transcriptional regulator [Subtercola endophyticus]UFS60173.1 Lrp/AsnC family transcriptional regulator [Subtercola endophyticus]